MEGSGRFDAHRAVLINVEEIWPSSSSDVSAGFALTSSSTKSRGMKKEVFYGRSVDGEACGEITQAMSIDAGTASLTANFTASQAGEFTAQVLTNTQGRAELSSKIVGFVEARSGPPQPPEDWEAVT